MKKEQTEKGQLRKENIWTNDNSEIDNSGNEQTGNDISNKEFWTKAIYLWAAKFRLPLQRCFSNKPSHFEMEKFSVEMCESPR